MKLYALPNGKIAAIFPDRIDLITFNECHVELTEVGMDYDTDWGLEFDHPQRRYAFWKRASESDQFYTFKKTDCGYVIREHLGPSYCGGGWMTNQYAVTNTYGHTKIERTKNIGILPKSDYEFRLLSSKKAKRWLKMMIDITNGSELL